MIDTKIKGNTTEMECMLEFMKKGCQVSIPFGEDCRYDFIVDVNGKLLRIQCKTCSENIDDNGIVSSIHFRTVRQSGSNAKISTRTKYTKEEIDYFATSFLGKCYLVPVEQCSNEKTLRIIPPKNGQVKGITWLKNCAIDEVIKIL